MSYTQSTKLKALKVHTVDTLDTDQAAATLSSPRTPRHPMNFGGNVTTDYVNDGERKTMSKYPVDRWTRQGDRPEVDVEFLLELS